MTDRDRATSRPPRLRAAHAVTVEEGIGAGVGLVAGGVAGAIAGPIGIALGASIGAVVGDAVGTAMHEREADASKHDHELDDAIAVTSGSLGAGPVQGSISTSEVPPRRSSR